MSGEDKMDVLCLDRIQSGDHLVRYTEEDSTENGDHGEYSQSQPYHLSHFRSFSLDSHLNQYNLAPTSHGVVTLNNAPPNTPPNEADENQCRQGDSGPSPTDSDVSHSYHEDVPQPYPH